MPRARAVQVCLNSQLTSLFSGYLALCDLVMTGAMCLPSSTGLMCTVQAYVGILSAGAEFLWSGCISVYLWLVTNLYHVQAKRAIKWFHVVSWGWPAAMTVALVIEHRKGNIELASTNEPWCFIGRQSRDSTLFRVLTVYGPLWLNMVVCAVCCTCQQCS